MAAFWPPSSIIWWLFTMGAFPLVPLTETAGVVGTIVEARC
jgi:hypothetical protein